MNQWLWIAVAGGIGSVCRWGLSMWIGLRTGGSFPWGTFAVNALGCLLIGIVAAAIEKQALVSPVARVAIIVGFLGGFTTFSSFALEGFALASNGKWLLAGSYVALTNIACFAAVWVGHRLVVSV